MPGELANYPAYTQAWGSFKSITHPIIGNHDYGLSESANCTPNNGEGYYTYWAGQGTGVARPAAGAMTYSRPSDVNPPVPLKRIDASRGNSATLGVSGRWVRVGTSRGIRTSAGTRRLIWPTSVPRLSVMIARATD